MGISGGVRGAVYGPEERAVGRGVQHLHPLLRMHTRVPRLLLLGSMCLHAKQRMQVLNTSSNRALFWSVDSASNSSRDSHMGTASPSGSGTGSPAESS